MSEQRMKYLKETLAYLDYLHAENRKPILDEMAHLRGLEAPCPVVPAPKAGMSAEVFRKAGKSAAPPKAWPPANSLPPWTECAAIVSNSDFAGKSAPEDGQGPRPGSELASALHRFIYEYDDADPFNSAWFLHRLELVLNEAKRRNDAR